jgi:hypothetical protein
LRADLLRRRIVVPSASIAALVMVDLCCAEPLGERRHVTPRMEIPWPEWWNDMPPPGPKVTPAPVPETSARSTARPTAALLDMLLSWLTANFGLAAPAERPQVELVPRTRLAALRYHGLLSDQVGHSRRGDGSAGPLGDLQAVEAVYDDNKRTIYLPEDWQGDTPAEVSVLVHELVHHLQNGAGLKFQCPQERERTAFDAQIRWLEIFGKTLEEELGIDAFDTLVRTTCFN